ncbi:MAG: GntR family transcriptional regulator [Flavicella sp.]
MENLLSIDEKGSQPIYKQIVSSILFKISTGELQINDKIPSINSLSEEYYISRDTVERAYNVLKEQKIIKSVRGKGNYIANSTRIAKINVLFLVNKLSSYKIIIYNAFVKKLGKDYNVVLKIYNCDTSFFIQLLEESMNSYDYYVIMPHFVENDKHITCTADILDKINSIPIEKLIVLDNKIPDIKEDIVSVYQDFEKDIFNALEEALMTIKKYEQITIVYPGASIYPFPNRILRGVKMFCNKHSIYFETLEAISKEYRFSKGTLYIVLDESDLISLLRLEKLSEFSFGKEIGIISYNDTPLKELMGITVVSTDFKLMGNTAAEMVLNATKITRKNPFKFINRYSM